MGVAGVKEVGGVGAGVDGEVAVAGAAPVNFLFRGLSAVTARGLTHLIWEF